MLSKYILLWRVHDRHKPMTLNRAARCAYLKAWKLTMQENEP